MLADAVHSLSDMVATFVVMIGVKMANRKADKEHPYGHERFEAVAAIILSIMLFATGAGIGWAGVQQIIHWEHGDDIAIPGMIALVAAVVTIALKGIMYIYKIRVAKKIDSGALKADAWHHLSDSLSSIGSFAGILGARMGFPILDPIAAIAICLFILKASLDIFRDAISKMTDRACDDETQGRMREVILAQEGVMDIDLFKTRIFGDRIYVEVEISVDGTKTLQEAHEIAHKVEDAIESEFPKVKHCMVHMNPV
jgi:cation diffusion facilitator family transporter